MGFGTPGKVLWVDLTRAALSEQVLDEAFYRLYPGGKALAAYFLLHEAPVGTDPLSPENVLVIASGLLCGAPIPTATRFTVAAHSPLTGGYGESEAGGYWGPELRFAGYEALVIQGKADRPVYLLIRDGKAEIRDAAHLWGRDPDVVQQAIRDEQGDKLVRVLQTGIGGENLVRFAALTNELRHFNGRTGMGAVMGSKKLKAIAVRGHSRFGDFMHSPAELQALGKKLSQETKEHPAARVLREQGTPSLVDGLNAAGILPTRNFRMGSFAGAPKINWGSYADQLFAGRRTCYACAVQCKREVRADEGNQVSGDYGGPEYETLASFGSNCLVDDLQVVARANELCNRYTLDTISTGATIAFAMECFENGLIGLEDTGGIDLRFGSSQAVLQMIEQIAHRQGFGALLAEGSRRAAHSIGKGSEAFAMQVKGEELPMHDPRGKASVGLGYAIGETGADHLVTIHDTQLSNPEAFSFKAAHLIRGDLLALPPRDLSEQKVSQYLTFENWVSFGKAAGLCYFGPAPRSFMQPADVLSAIHYATGWDFSMQEALAIGERATNLARLFNLRQGFGPADDVLPARLFEALENGPLEGISLSPELFQAAMQALYRLKGWDLHTGAPARDRLQALGIEWAAPPPG